MPSAEPCDHSKKPCIHSNEPYILLKEPRIHSKYKLSFLTLNERSNAIWWALFWLKKKICSLYGTNIDYMFTQQTSPLCYVCVGVCIYIYIYIYIHVMYVCVCAYIYISICIYTHTLLYKYIHICIYILCHYVCVHVIGVLQKRRHLQRLYWKCVCVFACGTYIYIYICIHTRTHILFIKKVSFRSADALHLQWLVENACVCMRMWYIYIYMYTNVHIICEIGVIQKRRCTALTVANVWASHVGHSQWH